ncbi:hypothetical protein [Candidatus Harpocratesius sp.]
MDIRITLIQKFWDFFDKHQFEKALSLLHTEFQAIWVTSNEYFQTKEAFIQANCHYPGKWHTHLKRIELFDSEAVSVVKVFSKSKPAKYYATSFYKFKENLILEIKEYWATVENPPEWRKKYATTYLTE